MLSDRIYFSSSLINFDLV